MINGLGNMGGGSSGGGGQDCKSQIKGCWDSVPAWCRFVFIACIVVYSVSFGLPLILMWFICAS